MTSPDADPQFGKGDNPVGGAPARAFSQIIVVGTTRRVRGFNLMENEILDIAHGAGERNLWISIGLSFIGFFIGFTRHLFGQGWSNVAASEWYAVLLFGGCAGFAFYRGNKLGKYQTNHAKRVMDSVMKESELSEKESGLKGTLTVNRRGTDPE